MAAGDYHDLRAASIYPEAGDKFETGLLLRWTISPQAPVICIPMPDKALMNLAVCRNFPS
jgi:hypothetical protein